MEDRDVILAMRFAEQGDVDSLRPLAVELVAEGVAVIVAPGLTAVNAARDVTTSVPIIMVVVEDVMRSGLVDSLRSPGGNITGVTVFSSQLSGKRLEILKRLVPGLSRAGVLWNRGVPEKMLDWEETRASGGVLGIDLLPIEVSTIGDVPDMVQAAVNAGAEAIQTLGDPMLFTQRKSLVGFLAETRLPVMYTAREYVVAGGLMCYGTSYQKLHQRAAYFVDRILKGIPVAELPIERPREFELVVNRRALEALNVPMPRNFTLSVTEMIES